MVKSKQFRIVLSTALIFILFNFVSCFPGAEASPLRGNGGDEGDAKEIEDAESKGSAITESDPSNDTVINVSDGDQSSLEDIEDEEIETPLVAAIRSECSGLQNKRTRKMCEALLKASMEEHPLHLAANRDTMQNEIDYERSEEDDKSGIARRRRRSEGATGLAKSVCSWLKNLNPVKKIKNRGRDRVPGEESSVARLGVDTERSLESGGANSESKVAENDDRSLALPLLVTQIRRAATGRPRFYGRDHDENEHETGEEARADVPDDSKIDPKGGKANPEDVKEDHGVKNAHPTVKDAYPEARDAHPRVKEEGSDKDEVDEEDDAEKSEKDLKETDKVKEDDDYGEDDEKEDKSPVKGRAETDDRKESGEDGDSLSEEKRVKRQDTEEIKEIFSWLRPGARCYYLKCTGAYPHKKDLDKEDKYEKKDKHPRQKSAF
nr:PREDICTED: YTH domain-containing protein 1-like [Bemisia tabaci]